MVAVNYAIDHASFCELLSYRFYMMYNMEQWLCSIYSLVFITNIHIPEWGNLGMRLAICAWLAHILLFVLHLTPNFDATETSCDVKQKHIF